MIKNAKTFRRPAFLHLATLFALFIAVLALNLSAATPTSLPANSTSEEIQRALDSAGEGGEVVLAAGNYQIRRPVILSRAGQILRGHGADTVLFLADNANCPVIIMGAPLTSPRHSTARLRVADLSIDGNRSKQQKEFWKSAIDGAALNNNGVTLWNTADCTVEGVTTHACRSGGLVTSSEIRRLTVRNFTAYDNQFDGLACYLTEDSLFTQLNLHDNLSAGISLDLAFNHNVIRDAVLRGNDLGVFMRHSRDNKFDGLTVEKNRHYGVFIAQRGVGTSAGWHLQPGTECIGNTFTKLHMSDSGPMAFHINDASCTNNLVMEDIKPAKIPASLAEAVLRPAKAQ